MAKIAAKPNGSNGSAFHLSFEGDFGPDSRAIPFAA